MTELLVTTTERRYLWQGTVEELIVANVDTPNLIAAVSALSVGKSMCVLGSFGIGAGQTPMMSVVTRLGGR